jgi:hypothetical protein
MQQVISEKQARAITGGRKPLVPVVYEEAVKSLAACLSLDEAHLWDNKADALAAWAKIYHDGKVARQAKALKLLAARRMGELAKELSPVSRTGKGAQFAKGTGPAAALRLQGLSPLAAKVAVRLAGTNRKAFDTMVDSPRPPAPITAAQQLSMKANKSGTTAWQQWAAYGGTKAALLRVLREDPTMARTMSKSERELAHPLVRQVAEWCDAFLQAAGR